MEKMLFLKDFIKYNTNLISLNLENTGLIEPAIMFIVALLTKSQALRCLHLCFNEGISDRVVEWVRTRIKAKEHIEPRVIQPYKQMKLERDGISKKSKKIGAALIR